MNYKYTNIIPTDLISLFNYYHKEILKSSKSRVQETSTEYIIESIKSKKIPEKTLLNYYFII